MAFDKKLWQREYQRKNKERYAENARDRYARNPAKCRAYSKKWRAKNKSYIETYNKNYHRDYYLNHKTEVLFKNKKYRVAHLLQCRESSKIKSKNYRHTLSTAYVQATLSKILKLPSVKQFPADLIAVKREQMRLRRLLKETTPCQ